MASTYTPNLAVERPANGDYVGTWDVPVNSNMTTFDLAVGTIQAISLAAGSVTLSTAQARSAFLNFTGNLVASVTVTIPGLSSSPGTLVSGKGYTVQNQCGNSSAFSVTLTTTVAGQQVIGVPPYEPCDILIEGTNSSQAGSIKFRNLDRIGAYWDYAGSSVPAWISDCTVPPYLNCTGTTFSSATYPALTVILGGTTLPDSRGRSRFALNQGTARISTAVDGAGFNGDTVGAGGGDQRLMVHTHGITDPNHIHAINTTARQSGTGSLNINSVDTAGTDINTDPAATGITINSAGSGASNNVPPAYIGGLTLIRAA